MADASQIRKIESIIRADPRRRFIVVSAPGKRSREDQKVTDLLYLCHELAAADLPIDEAFHLIRERFLGIAAELSAGASLASRIQEVEQGIRAKASRDWVASRGEYLAAILVADHLKAHFVDTERLVKIREDGRVDESTYGLLASQLQGDGLFVIPGFYGCRAEGQVKTLPRGGSDITGAVVARAAKAEIYENWTGRFRLPDDRSQGGEGPQAHAQGDLREIRELAYMGADVFHEEAIFPVFHARIPINIRNTNGPRTRAP